MRLESRAYHAILGAAAILVVALGPPGQPSPPGHTATAPTENTAMAEGSFEARPAPVLRHLGSSAAVQESGFPAGPREDDDARFHAVGSQACRVCHRAIWQAWERTPHARAAEALDFDQRLSPDCQPCHLPYDEVEPGVGCEACHGPGSAYAALAVMIDPYKRQRAGLENALHGCVECHNSGHPFHRERDLEAARRRVHPVPR